MKNICKTTIPGKNPPLDIRGCDEAESLESFSGARYKVLYLSTWRFSRRETSEQLIAYGLKQTRCRVKPFSPRMHSLSRRFLTLQLYFAGLLAAGYFTFVPLTLAHGNTFAGHMSAVGRHGNGEHNEHCRYSNPFWDSAFSYHVGIYDSNYSYTPTAEQQVAARQQVEAYLLAVNKRRKHAATHRYISVETLRPTKKQLEDFTRNQPPARRVEPAQLRCLMVFDTQTREFVGSGCYVVSSEPSAGEVAQFESVNAEFVGHERL